MIEKEVNPDFQREREKCTFNVTEMINFIDGGAHMTEERKKRGNFTHRHNLCHELCRNGFICMQFLFYFIRTVYSTV